MHRHFIFHKPFNCLSQFIYEGRRKSSKHVLGEYHDFPKGTMSIGRLDESSEGLLLLTTDGKVSYEITSSKFEKEYYVQVQGVVKEEDVVNWCKGVEIALDGGKYLTKPAKVRIIERPSHLPLEDRNVRNENHGRTTWLSIAIREGKYRQVRKMTSVLGYPTIRLIRYRIGEICLDIGPREVLEVKELI